MEQVIKHGFDLLTEKDAAVAYYTHTTTVGLTTDMFLTVALMEAQDQGNYTCYCTNSQGSAHQTITVKGYNYVKSISAAIQLKMNNDIGS